MGNIKSRILKLEKSMLINNPEPVKIARFIIGLDAEPDGYTCNGVEIVRELGESSESLRKRCQEAVNWPDAPCSRLVFYPQAR